MKGCTLGSYIGNVDWKGRPQEKSGTENDLGMDCPS